ncbi:hypothetical protein ACEYYH_10535 [Microbacterium trichothecenolyticum]|uniref:hypothetical protein n=1 Tax=Microbacterium trichothecenolyticum TaxID=69370 RepID=UPI0035BE3AAF
MSEGLSASRLSLQGERTKATNDLAATDAEIASLDERRSMLQSRRDFLQGKVDQLTEGINALRAVERGGTETEEPSVPDAEPVGEETADVA